MIFVQRESLDLPELTQPYFLDSGELNPSVIITMSVMSPLLILAAVFIFIMIRSKRRAQRVKG